MTTKYAPLTVTLDDEHLYDCLAVVSDGAQPYTDPSLGWRGDPFLRWNGWIALPWFDRATVERMAKDFEAWEDADQLRFDGDTLVVHSPVYADEDERMEPTVIDGVPRWCVGGMSMTWGDVGEEASREVVA